jgi:NADH-quinone oxidoreductase subunit J
MDAFFFWLFSFGMIGSALVVILHRNPVASALSFALSIVFMAGLFVLLSAFFLAAVQILVTAGAVMVLFLFIIMLLNPDVMEHVPRQKLWTACSLLLALGFLALVGRTLHDLPRGQLRIDAVPSLTQTIDASRVREFGARHFSQASRDHEDDTHRIGRLLFTRYVAPFELTSLLILVATIGVVVLCKQEEPPRPAPEEELVREAPPLKPREMETVSTR